MYITPQCKKKLTVVKQFCHGKDTEVSETVRVPMVKFAIYQ